MPAFHSFILLAEMRTGSNFLETNLNAFDGISCFGELFNPFFIGYPNRDDMLGFTQAQRDDDPLALLERIRAEHGIAGFRFFHDHDPRVLDACLDDPGCAKIILTRNPADSYISWKIARATGQWKLTNAKAARRAQAAFDAEEFETHLDRLQAFQITLLNRLQRSGQTAFYIGYDDLHDLEVLNGLAAWLGCPHPRDALDASLKPQNAQAAAEKVENFDDMQAAIARMDPFNLSRTPNFEPRRGPVVPSYVAAAKTPLLYQPVRGGPESVVRDWLGALDSAPVQQGFTQKTLRDWQRANRGHRTFTVLRHPVARAHAAYCEKILPADGSGFAELRELLRKHQKVAIPARDDAPSYDHAEGFKSFLRFLARNLGQQTNLRIDPHWASQTTVLEGLSAMRPPDMVIREEELESGLAMLAAGMGHSEMPAIPQETDPYRAHLDAIYDGEIEKLTRAVYARDYLAFGFDRWR